MGFWGCLAVTMREVRSMAPLLALRGLPRVLTRRSADRGMSADTTLLDAFAGSGFVYVPEYQHQYADKADCDAAGTGAIDAFVVAGEMRHDQREKGTNRH